MKPKRNHKREKNRDLKDFTRDGGRSVKKKNNKFKYRHKNHWLDEDAGYEVFQDKNEEE